METTHGNNLYIEDLASKLNTKKLSPIERAIMQESASFINNIYSEAVAIQKIQLYGHDIGHSERVSSIALLIAANEGFDQVVSFTTAQLHDAGRASRDERSKDERHGELSVEIIQSFLDQVKLPRDIRTLIETAIAVHPQWNTQLSNPTWLDKLLQDADKLDQICGIGPFRAGSNRALWPIVVRSNSTSTAEHDLQSARDDWERTMEWLEKDEEGNFKWFWTHTGKKIAESELPLLKQITTSFDRRAKLTYSIYDSIIE